MTSEQEDAMLNEGIYPDDGADTHRWDCDCEDCEPDAREADTDFDRNACPGCGGSCAVACR